MYWKRHYVVLLKKDIGEGWATHPSFLFSLKLFAKEVFMVDIKNSNELTVEEILKGEHPEFKEGDLLEFLLPTGEKILTILTKENTTDVHDNKS